MNLIMGSILPFVQDRSTWNNLCVANKELRDAGRTMTPPWPETTVQQVGSAINSMVFSPCGNYLACATMNLLGNATIVAILDRRNGQQTSLLGHRGDVSCLAFSDDGKYLASVGSDGLIRIWPTDSARKPTQQGLKTLPGHPDLGVRCLAFALDSNLLASGSRGEIKLWNVEDGVCVHSIHHRCGNTSSLVFSGVGESIRCLAATPKGSLIRISRKNSSDYEFTSESIVDGTALVLTSFSQCGSFLATIDPTLHPRIQLCLHEVLLNGVSKRQNVTLPAYCGFMTNAGMAFSPDNKMLAVISDTSSEDDTVIRLLDMKDLTLQRQFKWQFLNGNIPISLAVDPSGRYLASSFFRRGSVRLWTV
jgi:WD40 repeat protein